MTFEKMLRVLGWISIIGGCLIVIVQLWLALDPQSFIAAYFSLIGFILAAIGLIGLYFVQYKSLGGLGLFSFLLLSFSMYLWIGYQWFQTFFYIDLIKSIPELYDIRLQSSVYGKHLALYSMLSGTVIFAGLSIWKGILSRWGAALFILAPVALFFPFGSIAACFLFGIALIWTGIHLCRKIHSISNQEDFSEELLDQEPQEKKLEANHS
nr:hypothetical protein [uncultured Bacillus sp.]